jgi:long-chain acyl-CoA synthetase
MGSFNLPSQERKPGSIGVPIGGTEFRLVDDDGNDVPAGEPGEIAMRGPFVMRGYWERDDATAETIRDGWFHTGDIGTLDADGYLRITDRKKDLLVTSGGKKVAPQPIEAVLKRSPLVAEAVLLGDRRRFVSALIVPEFVALERRLKDLGRPPAEHNVLVTRQDVVALYDEIVEALNRDLSPFERIKKIGVLPREFTIQAGELTPTMKVKRKVVEVNWRKEIDEIYRESSG